MKPISPAKLRRHLDRLQQSLPAALLRRFVEADLMTQAASLSFYTLLSLAPLLVLLLWLTASLYPPAQQSLVAQIGDLAGPNAAAVAATVIRNADARPDTGSLAGWWSLVLLFVGSTVVFAQLQGSLNLIFRTAGERLGGLRVWLRKRVFSLGVVLALGFLLIVSMIATTALQVVFARLPSLLPAIGYTTTLLLYALAFAFLYHYLPDRRVAWRQAFLGGPSLNGTQFDLAAAQTPHQQLAHGGFQLAQFVRQAEGDVEESAVDRADLHGDAGQGGFTFRDGAGAGAGEPGHAVNWHEAFAGSKTPIMSKPKPAPLPSGTVVGGYQVIKKLAAGGFGVVYLAEDAERHLVALKEYLPSSLAERSPGELTPRIKPEKQPLYRLGLKSFFEEGRSLAQISHPSVVSVLNFFRENETVYMVMNYLEGATLQDFIITARELKKQKVFRESTIRSLFDEILRGLRIVHQHKMLHLDIKPANIFITDDNRAVMIDFGAAREVLSKEGNFIRPMYTPGFAAPEMYRRDSSMGPWTDIYAIGACIYACMQGYPPNDAPQRLEKDRLSLALSRLRGVYSDNLIEVVEWCMSLDPLSRPQSVFALQKELSREGERRYTKLSVGEKMRLQFDNMVTDTKKNMKRSGVGVKAK